FKTFNDGERLIDKTKVTCVRWVPGSVNQFLCSHHSGNMYLYNDELICTQDRPHYQLFKEGEGFSIYTCKTKTTRNPLYRWSLGDMAINEFAFSPCSKFLAVVSQDGFLRIFNFDTMDLIGSCRSYYGGLICVCWSPDGRYVVCGGEDDLLTIWSFSERRVVARGAGHKSWVTVVAFDPYTTLYGEMDGVVMHNEESYNRNNYNSTERSGKVRNKPPIINSRPNSVVSDGLNATCYRLGSVGQDTLLCLWDLKDDYLRQSYYRPRSSTVVSNVGSDGCPSNNTIAHSSSLSANSTQNCNKSSNHVKDANNSTGPPSALSSNSLTAKLASLNFVDRRGGDKTSDKDHKRSMSLAGRNSSSNLHKKDSRSNNCSSAAEGDVSSPSFGSKSSVGTSQCPRMDECPLLEPLVSKKIGHERLTGLVFREDCIVTACQDGCIHTWCRPGKQAGAALHSSPSPSSAGISQPLAAGGTVV
ncbi:WD repeat-containing protein 20-like, partial [Hyalella azteca]|uniref:WD repeat-containing protein 20-like n=1 Tax=Hyalella azteca TaxID=294128 RepID=A0A8B7NNB9_HYAAZ